MDDSSYSVHASYDTPPPGKPSNPAGAHTRTYQGKHELCIPALSCADPAFAACIPCRRRKVRCDLGSVDNPHDPPCVRCRRESKECYFSSTRRKKKNADGGEEHASDSGEDSYMKSQNGRKRLRTTSYDAHRQGSEDDEPRTPGGSIGRPQPLRRPTASQPAQYREEEQKASEQTVGLLQATEVHGKCKSYSQASMAGTMGVPCDHR